MSLIDKIITLETAVEKARQYKNEGKPVVFTNGCFDILHAGHVMLLEKAKSFGQMLFVGLNTDRSVKRLKGENRPLNTENNRAVVLAALESVDYVVFFDENTPCEIIDAIRPDIHVKGGDYNPQDVNNMPEAAVIAAYGGEIKIVPILPGHSTTGLINKMSSKKLD